MLSSVLVAEATSGSWRRTYKDESLVKSGIEFERLSNAFRSRWYLRSLLLAEGVARSDLPPLPLFPSHLLSFSSYFILGGRDAF